LILQVKYNNLNLKEKSEPVTITIIYEYLSTGYLRYNELTNEYSIREKIDNIQRIQGIKNIIYSVSFQTNSTEIILPKVSGVPNNVAVNLNLYIAIKKRYSLDLSRSTFRFKFLFFCCVPKCKWI
jgi:hypothetical protein